MLDAMMNQRRQDEKEKDSSKPIESVNTQASKNEASTSNESIHKAVYLQTPVTSVNTQSGQRKHGSDIFLEVFRERQLLLQLEQQQILGGNSPESSATSSFSSSSKDAQFDSVNESSQNQTTQTLTNDVTTRKHDKS